MSQICVTFRSITAAQMRRGRWSRRGLPAQVLRTPRALQEQGCGLRACACRAGDHPAAADGRAHRVPAAVSPRRGRGVAGGGAMIYFDSAATTLQKPESVYAAVQRTMRACASVGRGGHAAADAAARVVYACRTEAAELFDAAPEQVVFTMNATHGLEYCPCAALSGRAGASCCPAWSTMPSRGRLRRSGRRLNGRRTAVCAGAAARGLCARPAAGERMRRCARMFQMSTAMCCPCQPLPRCAGNAASRSSSMPRVRGNAAGQPARDGCGLHRHAGAQGAVWPAGTGLLLCGAAGGAAAAGRHGEQFARSEHAGFPAGPPRGGHAQRLRHRRPAGWPALCARAAAGKLLAEERALTALAARGLRQPAGRGGVHGAGAERRSVVPLPGPRLRGRPPPAWRRPGSPCGPGCTVRRWPTAAAERSRPERSG